MTIQFFFIYIFSFSLFLTNCFKEASFCKHQGWSHAQEIEHLDQAKQTEAQEETQKAAART